MSVLCLDQQRRGPMSSLSLDTYLKDFSCLFSSILNLIGFSVSNFT